MKKFVLMLLILFGILTLASSGWSYTVSPDIIVGDLDSLVDSTHLSDSGESVELDWVNSLGLGTFTWAGKTDFSTSGSEWKATIESSNVFAFDLLGNPEYFLIKTGGKKDVDTDFLFRNNDSFDWAVVSLGDVNVTAIQGVSRLSHLSEFGETSVPEPSMLMLFGSGLLGLGFFARKNK
jgi:hypothetical protein